MSIMLGVMKTNTKRLEIKDSGGKVVGSISISKSPEKTTKKRLPYSYKQISTRLLQTKKSGSAHQVLISAKQKVVSLRLMYKNGVYNDDEVFAALLHAQAITRVAKKRMKHLEEEERVDKKGGFCEGDLEEKTEEASEKQLYREDKAEVDIRRMQKLMEQYERMMQEAMIGLNGSISMDPEDLELMKKKHRADEMRDIMEADMKYLKFMFNKLEKEKQSNSSASFGLNLGNSNNSNQGVSLQLGGVDIPVEAAPDAMTIVEGGAIDATV